MRHTIFSCSRLGFALAATLLCKAPLRAGNLDANPEVAQLQARAEALQSRAGQCEGMKCRVCDCADMARKSQALVDAETALVALHRVLIEQDAEMRAVHHNAVSNSQLTDTMLAQLQTSLAYEEFFHKLGSYILKITSIANTAQNLADGKIAFTDDTSALQTVEQLDSLAGLLKNASEIAEDEKSMLETGAPPPASEPRKIANLTWDAKSAAADIAKAVRDARNAYKTAVEAAKAYPLSKLNYGAAGIRQSLQDAPLRNGLNAVARILKVYSELKLKAEKELEKEMLGYQAPEAAAITAAYKDWQRARARLEAAEAALGAVRAARQSLAAAMGATDCGAASLARTPLGPFGDGKYGAALKTLDPMLPGLAARLDGGIPVNDPDATPAPLPPPRHSVGNKCGKCSALEPELARTLDQLDFTGQEMGRIREDLGKADEIDQYADINRDAIKRISALIQEFRYGKKAKNALLQAGDALFRWLGKPHTEISILSLERQKRQTQNELRAQEARMASLRSEKDQLRSLDKEQTRLYEAGEKLKIKISVCRSEVPADLTGSWTDRNSCGEYEIKMNGSQVSLSHAGYQFDGTVKGDKIDLFHTLTYGETSTELPGPVRQMVVGEKVEITGDTSADCRGIDAVFIKNHPHWKETDGKYSIERQEVRKKKLRLRKVPKTGG